MKLTEFYSEFIKEGDLCFDIGAHVGKMSKAFLELGANVIAIEPQDCIWNIPDQENLIKIRKAVGEFEGEGEMMVSNVGTLSTLSKEWMESVSKSRRFPPKTFTWNDKRIVQITTLDNLMKTYGMPSFIKIDVEGYEYQVIRGLSKPVQALSIEFTPELLEPTFQCINYLSKLGEIGLNYSFNKPLALVLKDWVAPEELIEILSKYREKDDWPRSIKNNTKGGDVYIRFKNGSK